MANRREWFNLEPGGNMEKTVVSIIVSLLLFSSVSVAQEPPTNAAPDAALGDLEVKRAIEEEEAKRRKEKEELEEKKRLAEDELAKLKGIQEQLDAEIPAFERSLERAKEHLQECYRNLSETSLRYNQKEAEAKADFVRKIISELQAIYDERFRIQKAAYEKDEAFIAAKRWHDEDLSKIQLTVGDEVQVGKLSFEGGARNEVSGVFPIADFDEGSILIHEVPYGATFSAHVQLANPFVAALTIHPGMDVIGVGSTNTEDWDVDIFVAKDFRHETGAGIPVDIVAVRWAIDVGRTTCWQVKAPPVFEPTPMPVHTNVDETIPVIAKQIEEWVFPDLGEKKRLEDAQAAVKSAIHAEKVIARRRPRLIEQVNRKLEENAKEQREAQDQIDEIDSILVEYEIDADELVQEADDAFIDTGDGGDFEGDDLGIDSF